MRSKDYLNGYRAGWEAGKRPKDPRTKVEIEAEFDAWVRKNKGKWKTQ